jgi:predicted kinase
MENVDELNRIRAAVPVARIVVCRLRAPLETMRRRVGQREPGMLRDALVSRVAELDTIIDAASIEDFSVTTDDDRTVTEAAVEMLSLAHWIR